MCCFAGQCHRSTINGDEGNIEMKIGIDSYCYHRFFGEVYQEQRPPSQSRTMDDFIATARRLGVDGLSLETVFMPSLDVVFLKELRAKLDEAGLERMLAWGHPNGLEMGKNAAATEELLAHFQSANILGAKVIRIACASRAFRGQEPAQDQIARLVPILKRVAGEAAGNGLTLGIENHGDFLTEELIELLERVDSSNLGVTLDTGNILRLPEDPVIECSKLAPYTVATHIKDILASGLGSPKDWREWKHFWPSVGLGNGIIDLRGILQLLKDVGYTGMLCIEMDMLPLDRDEDKELEDSVAYLKRTLPTLR
jgi:3-oxoisoapionate decarboxylase